MVDQAVRACNKQKITGTREWASDNVNIQLGCEHGCRYCYARQMASLYGRIQSFEEWGTSYLRIRPEEVRRRRRKYKGGVMFPSTHDITPLNLEECVVVIRKLLDAGNDVLVVSKPHLKCIRRLCREFADRKSQLLFRFTIGAMDEAILGFWEPGAPKFAERLECLKHAHVKGFATSVSMEPMLDAPNIVNLFNRLKPNVTESIWIGKMNYIKATVQPETQEECDAVEQIKANQTDEKIVKIYEQLREEPLVQWKHSIKEVVGLPLADVPDMSTADAPAANVDMMAAPDDHFAEAGYDRETLAMLLMQLVGRRWMTYEGFLSKRQSVAQAS